VSNPFSYFLYAIVAGYFMLQCYYVYHWINIIKSTTGEKGNNTLSFSIIIAARNAEKVIYNCLASIDQINYPKGKYEILLINDHSEDITVNLVKDLSIPNLKIINQPEGQIGKKSAVINGINQATGDIVVCTDADCTVQPDWLLTLVKQFDDPDISCVCGPVLPVENESVNKILYHFQVLDFAGMMTITAVAIKQNLFSLGNGANLAFRREVVQPDEVDWKLDNASGDDIAIIHHLQKNQKRIVFSLHQNGVVQTMPELGWGDFFIQRLRWGSKNKASGQEIMILQLAILLLMCLAHFVALPYALFGLFFNYSVPVVLFVVVMSKYVADFILLWQSTLYFNKMSSMKYFPFLCWLHSGYISFAGLMSILPVSYRWKGRRVS
jgi:poly-beta-1,6-N-acetyl-D-glucosamine synthase